MFAAHVPRAVAACRNLRARTIGFFGIDRGNFLTACLYKDSSGCALVSAHLLRLTLGKF